MNKESYIEVKTQDGNSAIAELNNTINKKIDEYSEPSPLAIIPNNCNVVDLSKFVYPSVIDNRISFASIESFNRYLNEAKVARTKVYCTKAIVCAVIDEHDLKGPEAHRRAHQITLPLSYSEDFLRITNANRNWMPQSDFADFLADISHCIVEPDSAELIELAQELRGITKVTWRQGKRLKDGRTAIEYVEEAETSKGGSKGDIEIPDYIKISVPVFSFGEELVWKAAIPAEMRYRVSTNGVAFSFIMRNLEDIQRQAVQEVVAFIEKETQIKPFKVTSI